jgi:HTH-type transcriptional regulator/antitoxin HigA
MVIISKTSIHQFMEIPSIHNQETYQSALKAIAALMNKGESQLTAKEKKQLKAYATAVEAYEDTVYPLPKPTTLIGMIEFKMFERKLKQKELAQLLDIPDTRLSEVLNGKRKINLDFAKRIYHKLGIDAAFILETA